MKFLADESVDGEIVRRLRSAGHKVAYVAEMSPGITDEVVLHKAVENELLLITADKDFGELIFLRGKLSAGILLLRLVGLTPRKKADLTLEVVRDHGVQLFGSFTVVSSSAVRIRRNPQ